MPGVLQVEALAQTMARLRGQAAGLRRPDRAVRGHRRGPLQADRRPGRHAPPRGHDGEARQPLRQGPRRSRASTARSPARACCRFIIPPAGVLAMTPDRRPRPTSTATSPRSRRRWPRSARAARTRSLVAGDLVLNGPDPDGAIDALRAPGGRGRADRRRATPTSRSPTSTTAPRSPSTRTACPRRSPRAAEWAHDELGDDQLDWLRRLPAERRIRAAATTLVLVVHASPGSQTRGFDQALDAQRDLRAGRRHRRAGDLRRPHARARGPRPRLQGHRQRRLGAATSSTATRPRRGRSVTIVEGEVRRRHPADARSTSLTVANAISARGLPGDVYRAATVRTGKLVR